MLAEASSMIQKPAPTVCHRSGILAENARSNVTSIFNRLNCFRTPVYGQLFDQKRQRENKLFYNNLRIVFIH